MERLELGIGSPRPNQTSANSSSQKTAEKSHSSANSSPKVSAEK